MDNKGLPTIENTKVALWIIQGLKLERTMGALWIIQGLPTIYNTKGALWIIQLLQTLGSSMDALKIIQGIPSHHRTHIIPVYYRITLIQ